MIYDCPKYKKRFTNVNEELLQLKGDLDDKEARMALGKYLRSNIGVTVELISGVRLEVFQELILRCWFNRDFNLNIWGRGCSKTFLAAVFCFLYCIFYPGAKILIASPTFRSSRFIFNNLETIINHKESVLLQQVFCQAPSRRNDEWIYSVGSSTIVAIPLGSGERIRGFRASVLLLDEFFLLSKDVIETVLLPFLVSPSNLRERIEIRALEDRMIKLGLMHEENRVEFENSSKLIALSSATYTFEHLYSTYQEYLGKIYSEEKHDATYFVSQLSFQAIPSHMIEKAVIEQAESGGLSNAAFQREYCALFTDDGENFYSMKKMYNQTIPNGENPTGKIFSKDSCILAIDPSFSNSPASDNFAMSVLELDMEHKNATLIHAYAQAGADLKSHIAYLYYILQSFNIVYIILDQAGGRNFIDAANESELFKTNKINLKFLEFDSTKEAEEYNEELRKLRNEYNKENEKIVVEQYFTTDFIRKGNETLQKAIDYKQIWFASNVAANDKVMREMEQFGRNVDLKLTPYDTLSDFIENQEVLIHQTKKECALIEVKATAKGTLSFDLPANLKRNDQPNRARKDSYTALMLGNWAVRSYFDMVSQKKEDIMTGFIPIVIK